MKTSSAKAKGRALQKYVVDAILSVYSKLTEHDVKNTSMGAQGMDVQLSAAARKLFPYCVECKSWESLKGIYSIYDQAIGHDAKLEPLVIIKMNRHKPLAIISAEHFFDILKQLKQQRDLI